MNSSTGYVERGIASWYGTKFHGERTSSGEPYNMYAMTAAHKSLPLPTYVEVRNLQNGRTVTVKVNDRGPFVNNRIIDLSYTAAKKLGITGNGTGMVEIRAIDPYHKPVTQPVMASKPLPSAQENTIQAQLYLQVGAFQNRQNAERLRSRLEDLVISDIGIKDGYEKQKLIYRVRIGPLASVDEADRMADKLITHGFNDSRIIID
jgi:rare lipoprotein A